MVSHPETGSDSPIGSDQDRGRDTIDEKGVLEVHFGVPVIEDGVLYDLINIKRDVLNDGVVKQCPFRHHLANIRCRNETRGDKMVPHLRDIGQVFGLEVHDVPLNV